MIFCLLDFELDDLAFHSGDFLVVSSCPGNHLRQLQLKSKPIETNSSICNRFFFHWGLSSKLFLPAAEVCQALSAWSQQIQLSAKSIIFSWKTTSSCGFGVIGNADVVVDRRKWWFYERGDGDGPLNYLCGVGHRLNADVLILLVMLLFIAMVLYLGGIGHRLNASQERLQVPLTVGLSLFAHLFVSNI